MGTRQTEVLLSGQDEARLSEIIVSAFPEVTFVDGGSWADRTGPPCRPSRAQCGMTSVIWHRGIYPELPVREFPEGTFRGPQTGPVVQWLRAGLMEPGILRAGRLAAGWNDETAPEMRAFIQAVWRILWRETSNDLVGAAGKAERSIRLGTHARALAARGEVELYACRLRLRLPGRFN